MTIPKIELIVGDRNTEGIVLKCTGCAERYIYSWRQWKSDFTDSISDFEQFLQWAKWDAAQHECFLAGRVGYLVQPYEGDRDQMLREAMNPSIQGAEPERHEDPWGGVGYVVEPPEDDPLDFDTDCPTCGMSAAAFVDGDCVVCNPPIEEDEDDWIDLGLDEDEELDFVPEDDSVYNILPPYSPLDAAMTLNFRRFYERFAEEEEPFGDNYDWEENRFDFLTFDEHAPYGTVTGRLSVRHPHIQEVARVYSFAVEIDFAGIEQRMLDGMLFNMGIYTKDAQGNLRDEKGRCLACLRAGVHR